MAPGSRTDAARPALVAHAAAALAVVLWGLSFIATKIVLVDVRPTTLVFTRFGIGALLLLGLVPFARSSRTPVRPSHLFVLGFVGVFLHQMLQVFGLARTSATNTGWLIGLIPIWSALLAIAFLAERPGRIQVVGLLLGLVGATTIVGVGDRSSGFDPTGAGLGDLLIVISTVNWAAYTVYVRRTALGGAGVRTAAYSMVCGWLMLAVPFVATRGWSDYASLDRSGWIAVLFLGLGCSGLAYLCWAHALSRLPASSVASYLYVEPVVTQIAAATVLGEGVDPIVPVAGLVVLFGVFLVQKRAPRVVKPFPS